MTRHSGKILTSHAGSLPRPESLIELNRAHQAGETDDEAGFQAALSQAVADVVARQAAIGITVPGDGEFGKAMGQKVNYGGLVELFVLPARRARSGRPEAVRHAGGAIDARERAADELRRPS